MIRLTITLFHTFLAASTTTAAAMLWAQAALNRTWELGFYGATTTITDSLWLTGVLMVFLGVLHLVASVGYFVGSVRGSWTLIVLTWLLLGAYPAPIAVPLAVTGVLVLLDVMVIQHRTSQQPPTSSPPRG